MRRLIYGVGFNDADYPVQRMSQEGGKVVREWTCPFYQRWYDILRRCYNKKALVKRPNYKNVEICEEWRLFSNFKAWMVKQDWEGKILDKDLKVKGNNVYSPETCIFIDNQINTFIREGHRSKNNLKVGVSYHKRDRVYTAQCYNFLDKKLVHLGYHEDEESAHKVYLHYKVNLIHKFYQVGMVTEEVYNLLLKWYLK